MEPVIVSQADYEAGNYPKSVPIMIGMSINMEGRGGMNVGKKEPTKIKITFQPA